MKVITKEEFEQLPIVGRGHRSELFRKLLALEVGQGLAIEKSEWNKTYPPTQVAHKIAHRYKRKYRGGRDVSTGGWAILRIA